MNSRPSSSNLETGFNCVILPLGVNNTAKSASAAAINAMINIFAMDVPKRTRKGPSSVVLEPGGGLIRLFSETVAGSIPDFINKVTSLVLKNIPNTLTPIVPPRLRLN